MAREKTLARRERGELERLEPWNTFRDMERMFREFFVSPVPTYRTPPWMRELTTEYAPEVDLRETEEHYVLTASVPGMEKDDIDIDVTKEGITLTGERKSEEKYHVRQQCYGAFKVSYALPSEVKPEGVKATYRHGILEVTMPKAEVTEAHKVKVDVKD